jgi:hypothetical protein
MAFFCSISVSVNSSQSSNASNNAMAFNKLQSMVSRSNLRRKVHSLDRYNDPVRSKAEKKRYVSNFFRTKNKMSQSALDNKSGRYSSSK